MSRMKKSPAIWRYLIKGVSFKIYPLVLNTLYEKGLMLTCLTTFYGTHVRVMYCVCEKAVIDMWDGYGQVTL